MDLSFSGSMSPFCSDASQSQPDCTTTETITVDSISFTGGTTMLKSISFNNRGDDQKETPSLKSTGSGKGLKLQVSISFNGRDTETLTVSVTPSFDQFEDQNTEDQIQLKSGSFEETGVPVAAPVLVQSPSIMTRSNSSKMKPRRSFGSSWRRTGSRWPKLLESTELERSSTSSGSSETAKSRWCRAKVRAIRVGKGSSKNAVFRKLASQQWLEAVDPRHRYGHNLKFYYIIWRQSPSREPFLYWLDDGEGKDLNLVEICPRPKLHQERVQYLDATEREEYEVMLDDGKFRNKKSNQLIDTGKYDKWIFVLSPSGTLYVGEKKKGVFHHSSFLAGGAVSAAGRVVVENGTLKAISRQSGHYMPTEENFNCFLAFLKENNVDLKDVDTSLDEADANQPKRGLRMNRSQEDLTQLVGLKQGVKKFRRLIRRFSFVLILGKNRPRRSLSAPICKN